VTRLLPLCLATLVLAAPPLAADPAMECRSGTATEAEVKTCLEDTLELVDESVATAFEIAMDLAQKLDEVMQASTTMEALTKSQWAWEAYRDAQCGYVGATYGSGAGSGIGIQSCRITLARIRADMLLATAN